MKTISAKAKEINRKWFLADVQDKVLGRAATRIAAVLRGKTKPIFTPHVDTGDYVIVVNADKVRLTGKKMQGKMYSRHSGYPGGFKQISAEKLLVRHPDEMVKHAVKGMLPKGPLGRRMFKKLKVYAGSEHPHQAQKPEILEL